MATLGSRLRSSLLAPKGSRLMSGHSIEHAIGEYRKISGPFATPSPQTPPSRLPLLAPANEMNGKGGGHQKLCPRNWPPAF